MTTGRGLVTGFAIAFALIALSLGHGHTPLLANDAADHGVELNALNGSDEVAHDGKAMYSVTVKNEDTSLKQDVEVALRVLGGCGTVNGDPDGQDEDTAARVRSGQTKTVRFTVDWSGCADGSYIVQADACHPGDPATAGFFGVGACPGGDPHGLPDANLLDDAPFAINVEVGPSD